MVTVIQYSTGFAVNLNGQIVLSTRKNKPFSSEEKAWGFVKFMKFVKKDPRYQDAIIPNEYLETTAAERAAIAASKPRNYGSSHEKTGAKPLPNADTSSFSNHEENGSMSAEERNEVYETFMRLKDSFSHRQLAQLNSLLEVEMAA